MLLRAILNVKDTVFEQLCLLGVAKYCLMLSVLVSILVSEFAPFNAILSRSQREMYFSVVNAYANIDVSGKVLPC